MRVVVCVCVWGGGSGGRVRACVHVCVRACVCVCVCQIQFYDIVLYVLSSLEINLMKKRELYALCFVFAVVILSPSCNCLFCFV